MLWRSTITVPPHQQHHRKRPAFLGTSCLSPFLAICHSPSRSSIPSCAIIHSLEDAIVPLAAAPKTSPIKTILLAGLLAAILDGLDAAIFIGMARGVAVSRVFQFIASGLLGPKSFGAGWRTVALGILIHFFIALSAAAAYYAFAQRIPFLVQRPLIAGPLFGIALFALMHYLVVPLSAAPKQPPASWPALLNLTLSHIFFVGLPIALITSRPSR